MKVCDRHPRKPAKESITIKSSDSHYDLCDACAHEIEKFISDVKKESVEPKRKFFGKKKSA
jgi:hypothetical protein